MRDEQAQAEGSAGDPIRHAALIAFIARNYASDDEGRWYFQNGPQRVYVSLAYAPFVVRLTWDASANDGRGAPVLIDQLGKAFVPQICLLDEDGNVAFAGNAQGEENTSLALLHDHDIDLLTQVSNLPQAYEIAQTSDDTAEAKGAVRLHWRNGDALPFMTVHAGTLPQTYGFERDPRASRAD